jgi:hypothetical protein
MRELLEMLKNESNLVPARVDRRLNFTCSSVWHIDNDDDRFVEVSDSVNSKDFLVIVRDRQSVRAIVLEDPRAVVGAVILGCDALSNNREIV